MRYSKELLKGSTYMLILSVLEKEDLYGYMIIRELEMRSEHAFEMSEGTLYPILHALEKENYLDAYWVDTGTKKRKYYHITRKGIRHHGEQKEEWKSFSANVNKVLNFA
ncbi:MAG: helix-turn-helix transcriptional regulator [Clostridia bacterium]|nr:helix-turn-helix transcriptional regulator [Clostridia bacterium]